ncbi:hypothetical protein HNP84_004817 [Thermocatellispora tengchongensis]|uniref:Uncharacterized protein n=1 Tax=Thermocatellispora tengchongensis TaxID=1073253 RepID=A0A840PB42_9ACTN|nr:hypothetical protein [Thermocatellispora tengchongensis]MBB5135081.1 hypothetical protein [Thermocatellispora tengchongensis]
MRRAVLPAALAAALFPLLPATPAAANPPPCAYDLTLTLGGVPTTLPPLPAHCSPADAPVSAGLILNVGTHRPG